MTTFDCKRCGHIANKKGDLLKHLQRKHPCEPSKENIPCSVLITELTHKDYNDKTYDCRKCGKKFNACSNRHRHEKICTVVPITQAEEFKRLKEQLLQEIEAMKLEIKNTKASSVVNNNTNNTNNGINIINVNTTTPLRNFGSENMNAVPLNLIREAFMNLEFAAVFENLHCDPDYPENHNVRIKSTKQQKLQLYQDDRWKTHNYDDGFRHLISQIHSLFTDFAHKHPNLIEEDMDEDDKNDIIDKLDKIGELVHQTGIKLKKLKPIQHIQDQLEDILITQNDNNQLIA